MHLLQEKTVCMNSLYVLLSQIGTNCLWRSLYRHTYFLRTLIIANTPKAAHLGSLLINVFGDLTWEYFTYFLN